MNYIKNLVSRNKNRIDVNNNSLDVSFITSRARNVLPIGQHRRVFNSQQHR